MKNAWMMVGLLSVPGLANNNEETGPSFEALSAAGEFTVAGNVTAQEERGEEHSHLDTHRPDSHAPIGVMGDHVHEAGEWMISLRAMNMHMDGNRDGRTRLSPSEVFARGYMVTPTEMDMQMIMLGGMYAPTEDLTLTLMIPYLRNSMDHLTAGNVRFKTESEGLGDLRLGGLFKFFDSGSQRVHANLSLSLPTGSITERDATPVNPSAKLPYPMQLGSGTVDLQPGLTWTGQSEAWSYGAQALYTLRNGTNDQQYTLGDRFDATAWGARLLTPSLSGSLRLAWSDWENIDGADPELNPAMIHTADPNLRGGQRLDLSLGLNWQARAEALRGHRLALEFGVPVVQDLDGPQLETDWILTLGWQRSF